jgi:hypothetical protein
MIISDYGYEIISKLKSNTVTYLGCTPIVCDNYAQFIELLQRVIINMPQLRRLNGQISIADGFYTMAISSICLGMMHRTMIIGPITAPVNRPTLFAAFPKNVTCKARGSSFWLYL